MTSMTRFHPVTYAKIDLDALRHNYRQIRKAAGETPVLSVIKADAYGHGAGNCAAALYDEGCRFFGVANIGEALQLREALGERPAEILILGYTDPYDVPLLLENRLTQALFSADYAGELAKRLPEHAGLRVHIKLDTGMNRIGFSARSEDCEKTCNAIEEVLKTGKFRATGVFTHFACADCADDEMTAGQAVAFDRVAQTLAARGIRFSVRHAANSAAILRYPQLRLDMVRAGIILYGIAPSDAAAPAGLRPVMSLLTHVTHVHTVKAGEAVGYGASFRAERDMTVATLAVGYADGFLRAYAGGSVSVRGQLAPLIGRICMDQCMADVTGIPACPGDPVVLFGQDGENPCLSVERLAELSGSIPYETLCLVGKRVPRRYFSGGEELL